MAHDRINFENLISEQEKTKNEFINRAHKKALRFEKIRKAGGEKELIQKEFSELIESEKEKLKEFFGYEIEIAPLPAEITEQRYIEWKKMGFELHYLPKERLTKERDLPGWREKPHNLFQYIEERKVDAEALELPGQWILIDEHEKPDYDNGNQMYENDPLAEGVKELRERKILSDYKILGSRFFISSEDLRKDEVRQVFASVLKVNPEKIRLPRAIEFNFLGNAHYSEWGDTNTWESFADRYADRSRLHGGNKDRGGLSDINHLSSSDDSRPPGGFRLLVSF